MPCLARSACLPKGVYVLRRVEFAIRPSISPSLLVRLSHTFGECVAFFTIFTFFDLGCMLVKRGRLLILL